MTYKLINDIETGTLSCIQIKGTNTFIPLDPMNTDYAEYLEWAKTNTADAADTLTSSQKWANVRDIRNSKLRETDWTQGADVPNAIKSAWTSYRQALRDVPTQSDPDNITWPSKPS